MRVMVFCLLCLFLCSCVSTKVENINGQDKFTMYEDEKNLWARVGDLEKEIERSGSIYQDQVVTQYVNDVLSKIVGEEEKKYQIHLKVYVIKDPWFNAFIFPTGTMYVHTSVLANLENEAQLATVLSHEATHFFHRHTLKSQRNLVNMTAFYTFFNITAGGASGVIGGLLGSSVEFFRLLGSLGIQGAICGYSQDIERDADKEGFQFLVKAGYDPRESKKAYEKLDEALKEEKIKTPYFYQSHPRVQERIKNFDEFINKFKSQSGHELDGIRNEDVYAEKIASVILDNAEMDLSRGKFKYAKKEIERYIRRNPDVAKAQDLLGQADHGQYLLMKSDKKKGRKNKKSEDDQIDYYKEAQDAFMAALRLDPNYSSAYCNLALLFYKNGEQDKARPYFQKYLELNPGAMDAEYIRGYINEK